MAQVLVFADESGNLDFSGKGSRYFVLTTITLPSYALGDELLRLRRDLAWRGVPLSDGFHATTDAQAVRDEVFSVIVRHDLRIDATILTKARARPHLQKDEVRFYKTAWFLHMRYIAPTIAAAGSELLVVGASIGTRRRQQLFHQAIEDVVLQTAGDTTFRTASWAANCEPCLQAADYCSWAIQRKWEQHNHRSYDLIKPRIVSEFRAF